MRVGSSIPSWNYALINWGVELDVGNSNVSPIINHLRKYGGTNIKTKR